MTDILIGSLIVCCAFSAGFMAGAWFATRDWER